MSPGSLRVCLNLLNCACSTQLRVCVCCFARDIAAPVAKMAAAAQRASSSVVSCSRQSSISSVRSAPVSRRQSPVVRAAEVRVRSSWLLDHRHTSSVIAATQRSYRQLDAAIMSSTCIVTTLVAGWPAAEQQQQCDHQCSNWLKQPAAGQVHGLLYLSGCIDHVIMPSWLTSAATEQQFASSTTHTVSHSNLPTSLVPLKPLFPVPSVMWFSHDRRPLHHSH